MKSVEILVALPDGGIVHTHLMSSLPHVHHEGREVNLLSDEGLSEGIFSGQYESDATPTARLEQR